MRGLAVALAQEAELRITGSSVTRNSTAPPSLRWTWLCQAGTTITSPRLHDSLVPSTSVVPEPLATPNTLLAITLRGAVAWPAFSSIIASAMVSSADFSPP